VAEYCALVWSRSPHTEFVDVQLNSTMHLISSTLRSTHFPWLPILTNIEPLALHRKAASGKLMDICLSLSADSITDTRLRRISSSSLRAVSTAGYTSNDSNLFSSNVSDSCAIVTLRRRRMVYLVLQPEAGLTQVI